jgi:amino acid adenylation domain-containing protein
MNGNGVMSNTTELSEAKRALLEKYLRGDLPQAKTGGDTIPRHSPHKDVPLSFGQQQLWLLAQLMPNMPVYNECVTIRMSGPLDRAALEESFREIFRRHEAWRTSFSLVDGQPVQKIHPTLSFTLPVVDLRHLPKAEREAEALRLAKEEGKKPFDLAHVPLLRALLLRLSDDEHWLFLTLHHIIFDGITIYQVFLSELHTLYEAFSSGQLLSLPELSIQYADFAAWQREWLQGEVLAQQLAYWKRRLEGAPTILGLPTDHPRPQTPSYRGAMYRFTLPKGLTDKLRSLSSREGVTLHMTLLAAFNVLLYRYTGQEDILVGTTTAGRKRSELEKLMGIFINTQVMRTNLAGNPGFRELLQRVKEVTLEAHEHQDVPFEYLVKELQPERELGQNPLFQVMLLLEPPAITLPSGWSLTHMDVNTDTAKFDLSLVLEDRPEGFVGRFEYSTDLFETATIERMAGHWRALLEGIIAAPGQRLSELPILTEAERSRLVVEWNATATAYPRDRCVHQLFEEQVERTPDDIALVFEEQEMTYRELNKRANQLAHHLQKLGVQPETPVGLCMDRSLEMVVSLLGILKAGGAYVPLDLAYPRERLAFMLQDTQAPVLLAQSQFVDLLPTQDVQVVSLDPGWQAIAHESEENLPSETKAEDLAYIMYTSGSTGRPKGVEIRHRSINRLVFGVHYARLDATRRILHMAPISFDAATFELWGALLHGARCILYPERIPTPRSIGALIRKHKVTTAWLTASLFNAIIDEAPGELLGLEQLLTGGEALSVTHIRRALDLLPSVQLINGYGPHESTTFACCYSIPQQLSENVLSIPIGRPIGNTQVYILDRYLNPVPSGVPGELHIGGAGVARGYLNRPELTQEKFIVDPFSNEVGARLYKTGDLVRYLPDGNIEFVGRSDQQVKIRGFRIEPGEIEAVLGQHPAVQQALVLARQNERRGKSLVAYVVPGQEQSITARELAGYLKRRLPDYMIPSDFIPLDALPMTPNGKLDYSALPAPVELRNTAEDSLETPLLTVHHQLKQIWEDLLHVQPIGIHENFFDLGGHSLVAARLVDRIEQVFGKKLPLATFFSSATIERLAEVLMGEENTRSRTPLVTVQVGTSKRPFFFLHGDWAGGGFYCLNLARHLGADQPFYVLEPYKFEDLPVPPTFEAMAAAHIDALRAFQPEGPYLLGGFCNGGLMAYEMARQLQAQGQTVELLALIDPASPGDHRLVRSAIGRFGSLIRASQEKQLEWFLRYIYLRIASYRSKVQAAARRLSSESENRKAAYYKKGPIHAKFDPVFPTVQALRYPWAGTYRWIVAGYDTLKPYPGKITLLWASEAFARCGPWRNVSEAKDVETHIFPGTHFSCKTDNLHIVAGRLKTYLNKDTSS